MNFFEIYEKLFDKFGEQHWWPGDTAFEIIVGAILTQQASWKNVEAAIKNLKNNKVLDEKTIYKIELKNLEELVRPSGFYRIKAKRLKNFVNFLFEKYDGSLEKLFSLKKNELRKELLSVNGIGKETADSIVLYAANKPSFVVDAYTIRIFNRLGILKEKEYDKVKAAFENNLPQDVQLYKEYHALIVNLGKNICKTKPLCDICPLKEMCEHAATNNNHLKEKSKRSEKGFK
ncbi:MAG: endonuclease III domain-containing protein [Candidatus Aenigmatarchaeota archaeon]|nr:endonuclease III domain-containing protein [Candidatus Aenigmarchaeota archaeon]